MIISLEEISNSKVKMHHSMPNAILSDKRNISTYAQNSTSNYSIKCQKAKTRQLDYKIILTFSFTLPLLILTKYCLLCAHVFCWSFKMSL